MTAIRQRTNYGPLWFIALLLALFIILGLTQGCRRPPTVARADTTERVIIRETIHDTTILIEQDSSWIQYYIDCQEGKAKLTELLSYRPGEQVHPPQVVIKDRILTAKCNVDSMAVYAMFKSRDTTKTVNTSQVVVNQVNYLTGWQWFQVWAFRIMAGFILIVLALAVLRQYTGFRLPWQK